MAMEWNGTTEMIFQIDQLIRYKNAKLGIIVINITKKQKEKRKEEDDDQDEEAPETPSKKIIHYLLSSIHYCLFLIKFNPLSSLTSLDKMCNNTSHKKFDIHLSLSLILTSYIQKVVL